MKTYPYQRKNELGISEYLFIIFSIGLMIYNFILTLNLAKLTKYLQIIGIAIGLGTFTILILVYYRNELISYAKAKYEKPLKKLQKKLQKKIGKIKIGRKKWRKKKNLVIPKIPEKYDPKKIVKKTKKKAKNSAKNQGGIKNEKNNKISNKE